MIGSVCDEAITELEQLARRALRAGTEELPARDTEWLARTLLESEGYTDRSNKTLRGMARRYFPSLW